MKKKKKKKKKLPRRDRFYFWLWLFEMMARISFSQSKTISRAELILIQITKIKYYNRVSFSLIFLLSEKKKEKKKKKKKKKKLPRRCRFYFRLWLFEIMTRTGPKPNSNPDLFSILDLKLLY